MHRNNSCSRYNVKHKDLYAVYKHNKQSGKTASKQYNSESTPKVTNVENNQTQKDGF